MVSHLPVLTTAAVRASVMSSGITPGSEDRHLVVAPVHPALGLEAGGPHAARQVPHGATVQLEHAEGVTAAEQFGGRLVVQAEGVQVDVVAQVIMPRCFDTSTVLDNWGTVIRGAVDDLTVRDWGAHMTTVMLSIDSTDVDPARLDRLTTQLYDDLRSLKIIGVHRPEDAPVPGGKSGAAQSLGELVLTGGLSAGVVTAVYKVIVAYLDRVKARSVTWTQDGREVTLTGLPPREQEKMIKLLISAGGDNSDAAEK